MNTYLLINKTSNVVENSIVWDGSNSWTPPDEYIVIENSTAPAKVWVFNEELYDYVESIELGVGGIGFIWDGTNLITNQPKPDKPIKFDPNQPQPQVTGAQNL